MVEVIVRLRLEDRGYVMLYVRSRSPTRQPDIRQEIKGVKNRMNEKGGYDRMQVVTYDINLTSPG